MTDRNSDVDDVYKQLEGALCIWSRAKGESPQQLYFHEETPNSRRLLFGDKIYNVVITPVGAESEDPK